MHAVPGVKITDDAMTVRAAADPGAGAPGIRTFRDGSANRFAVDSRSRGANPNSVFARIRTPRDASANFRVFLEQADSKGFEIRVIERPDAALALVLLLRG